MTKMHSLSKSSDPVPERISSDISLTAPVSARSVFWRARYLRQSDFIPHVPVLFWLIETGDADNFVTLGVNEGVAHFAACQAMDKLRHDARCIGIEDWSASEGRIPDGLATYASETYHEVSELIDKAPEKAALDFDDGSVDILLIDIDQSAANTEALLRDWLPRLSDRSVVLVHGISGSTFKEEAGRSVLSRWQERFPMFCLATGRGLAVLLTGPQQNHRLRAIAELTKSHPIMRDIRRVFNRLGEAHQFEYESRTLAGQAKRAESGKSQLLKQVEDQKSAYDARNRQVGELQSRNHDLTRQHGAAQTELEALRKIISDLEERENASVDKFRSLSEECKAQKEANALLEAERDRYKAELSSHTKERQVQDEAIAKLQDEHDILVEQHGAARTELAALHQKISDLEAREQVADADAKHLAEELQTRFSELAALTREFEKMRQESAQKISIMKKEREAEKQENTALKTERDRYQTELALLMKEHESRNATIAKLRDEHSRDLALFAADRNTRFSEIATLTKEVERVTCERDTYRKHVDELLASTSWRITGPARKLVSRLRSQR